MGGEDFSGAGGVVDVDLQIFSNVDGFASAEIFLVDKRGLSGLADEGGSSDRVTLFVVGLLGAGGREEGCLFSSGFFSGVATFGGEGDLFAGTGEVPFVDRNDRSDRDDSELSLDGRIGGGLGDCFWSERWGDPEACRKDSARVRRDSVLLRSIAARLSVGDLTSPDGFASPEVRMKPRIVFDVVPAARSEQRSCAWSWFRSSSSSSLVVLVETLLTGSV